MNILKKTLSTIFCLTLLLSITSCGFVEWIKNVYDENSCGETPEGYTAGFWEPPYFYENREFHWVETFEEVLIAIEHLEAAGNDIPKQIMSKYETDLVDAKYCFIMDIASGHKEDKSKVWYDRKANRILIWYIGMLDDLSIEELEYTYYGLFRGFDVSLGVRSDIPLEDIVFDCTNSKGWCLLEPREKGELHFGSIVYYQIQRHDNELPKTFHEDFLKSLVFIGGKEYEDD